MRLVSASLPLLFLPAVGLAQTCPNEDLAAPNGDFATAVGLGYSQTSILSGLAATQASPADFFYVDVPFDSSGTIQINFAHSQADLDLYLYDDLFQQLDSSETVSDFELVSFNNTSPGLVRYYIEVYNYSAVFQGGDCGDYQLELSAQTSCAADDMFEGTDDCDTTLGLQGFSQGVPLQLILKPGDPDWFDVQLAANETLQIDMAFDGSVVDLDLQARELTLGGCGALLDSSTTTGSLETISVTNSTGTFQDVAIEAYWFGSSSGATCADYTITYQILPGTDPCLPDDAYEDNDTACEAVPILVGVYGDLRVGDGDPDFYSYTMIGGLPHRFAVDFDHSQGDVDLFVYDASGSCLSYALLGSSTSTQDFEEIAIDLAGLPNQDVVIEVRHFTTNGGCNTYQLTVGQGYPGSCLSEIVCFAQANSTLASAELKALGSVSVAANDLTLETNGLPQQSFGFFITSKGFGFAANPGGSAGDLCIAGAPIGRYVGPGQIQTSGAGSQVQLPIDLTQMPQPNGFEAAAQGETWYFQYWYRDSSSSGPTSNFSTASRIRFES